MNIDEQDVEELTLFPSKAEGFYQAGKYPQFNEFAKYIDSKYHIKADDSATYIYKDEYYQPMTSTQLDNMVDTETGFQVKPNHYSAFIRKTLSKCYFPVKNAKPPVRKINLKNGVLDVATKKMEPHSYENFFKYKLNHSFDPAAKCPRFEQFLAETFDNQYDLIELVTQMIGYIILGGDPFAHKAFVLVGEGRNGKSTLVDLLRDLIGRENFSSVPMKHLGKPFSMVSMDGKLANIVEETPPEIEPDEFKNIVGGGYVQASYKGKDEFQLQIQARLVFAANKLPRFNDTTIGNRDRLIFIPFKRYLAENERDITIKHQLRAEMSGILNIALRGIESLRANGNKFIKTGAGADMLEEYMIESDSVYAWCREQIEFTKADEAFLVTDDAFEHYSRKVKEWNQKPVGIVAFRKRFNSFVRQIFKENCVVFQKDKNGRKLLAMARKKGGQFLILRNDGLRQNSFGFDAGPQWPATAGQ